MPPGVSDEDLQKLQADNEKLREQLASAGAKRSEQEAARQREYEATALQAENVRLQAAVNSAKEAAKVSTTKEGVAVVQDAVDAQLEQAKAVLEAPPREVEPDLQPDAGQPAADAATPAEAQNSNGGN